MKRIPRWPVLSLVMLAACSPSTTTVVVVTGSPSATPPAVVASASSTAASSPTSTTPSTPQEAAATVAADLEAESGYQVKYAIVQPFDIKGSNANLAPIIDIAFQDTPKSFNDWTHIQNVLLSGGREVLESNGFRAYSVDSGFTLLLTVRLSDVEKVPGPKGHDVTELVLLRQKAKLTSA